MTGAAYKTLWIDLEGQAWSLMAGWPGFYEAENKSAGAAVRYSKDGTWVTAPPDSKPYLYAFAQPDQAIELAIHEFNGQIERDIIIPSTSPLPLQLAGTPPPQGHFEVWSCDFEQFPDVYESDNRFEYDWVRSHFAPAGTVFCHRLRLTHKLHDLGALWTKPIQKHLPDVLPEHPAQEIVPVQAEFTIVHKRGRNRVTIKIEAISQDELTVLAVQLLGDLDRSTDCWRDYAFPDVAWNKILDWADELEREDRKVLSDADIVQSLTTRSAAVEPADNPKHGYPFGQVSEVSLEVADVLINKGTTVHLALRRLSTETARLFASKAGAWSFYYLEELSDVAAQALAEHKGTLEIGGSMRSDSDQKTCISNSGALALARKPGHLLFNPPKGLSELAVRALCQRYWEAIQNGQGPASWDGYWREAARPAW